MTAGIPIAEAISLAKSEDAARFGERLGHGALVGTPLEGEGAAGWSFHTVALKGRFSRAAPGIDLRHAVVFPMRKAGPRFAETLLIGRAASNDVCIDSVGVSKLHARVQVEGADLHLRDADSKNGVEVNYAPLGERAHRLVDGDAVTFGQMTVRFYRPETLQRMLRAVDEA